jgi:hypothetical protein
MDAGPPTLTVRQAYEAMLVFLTRECDLTESEDLAELLAQYALTCDGGTRDPDAWESWLRATAQVTGSGKTGGSRP